MTPTAYQALAVHVRSIALLAAYRELLERFNPRAVFAEENGRRIGKVPK